jgi:rod shape-determining protein MreD
MTARAGALGVVLFTALLLQAVVAPAFDVGGWRPDLVLLTVVAFAIADGHATGARYGFAAGLCADLLSGGSQLVGLTALVFLLVGDGIGRLRPYLSGTGRIGEAALGALAGAVAFGLFGGLSLLLDIGTFTPLLLLEGLIATALWTALLTPVVTAVLRPIARRFPVAEVPTNAATPGSAARTW